MAEPQPKRSRHYAELVAIFLLVAFMVAVIFAGLAKMVPGMAPVAARGAELARPSDLSFYLLASMAMVSAAGVAFFRNIIYACLALLGALLGTGALYIYLAADYVAVTQLLIYVGGVLVLILFAVMLTHRIGDKSASNPSTAVLPGLGLLGLLLVLFGGVAAKAPWKTGGKPIELEATVDRIGNLFLNEYLLAFEVISLLLLATLIGAVVVARKEIKE